MSSIISSWGTKPKTSKGSPPSFVLHLSLFKNISPPDILAGAWSRFAMAERSVVLPHPEGPITPHNLYGLKLPDTFFKMVFVFFFLGTSRWFSRSAVSLSFFDCFRFAQHLERTFVTLVVPVFECWCSSVGV